MQGVGRLSQVIAFHGRYNHREIGNLHREGIRHIQTVLAGHNTIHVHHLNFSNKGTKRVKEVKTSSIPSKVL